MKGLCSGPGRSIGTLDKACDLSNMRDALLVGAWGLLAAAARALSHETEAAFPQALNQRAKAALFTGEPAYPHLPTGQVPAPLRPPARAL